MAAHAAQRRDFLLTYTFEEPTFAKPGTSDCMNLFLQRVPTFVAV